MKIKNYFFSFLILNFMFYLFNCLTFAEEARQTQSTVQPAAKAEPAELITLDYKDAELSSVLRALSYTYDLNLVAAKEIKGKVTINLTNVTVDEALDAILKVNGYFFSKEGKIIYIFPGLSSEEVGLKTESVSIKYLTASETEKLLQESLSSRGKIRINEATNSLIITDYPQMLNRVKEVIEAIDVQPIQVLIEAKLVDITSKDLENLGVTWSADYKPVGDVKGLFGRNTGYQEELKTTTTLAGPSSSLSGGQFKIDTLTFKGLSITATLDALIQDQKAHLLASPSIATLNGKEARIIIGEKYPYKEKTQTTTGTTETTKFVDVGTTLRVTPQVSPDGYITMRVHPEVSSVSASLDAGPRITTREADATIRVKDGQTIVIGGLLKKQDDKIVNRIPILGYIPIVGLLFSDRSSDLSQTELAVFITPHIIRSPEEAEVQEATREKEVYVNIEGKGERVLVSQLWEQARNLEKDEGIESRRKDKQMRMSEALDLYKQIASQFPGSERADDALYRAGLISYDFFADLDLSRRIFLEIVERYPDSPYVWKSRRMIEHIDKKLEAKERRKLPKPTKQKSQPLSRQEGKNKELTGNRGFIQGGGQ